MTLQLVVLAAEELEANVPVLDAFQCRILHVLGRFLGHRLIPQRKVLWVVQAALDM
jgi:hypothetical protein